MIIKWKAWKRLKNLNSWKSKTEFLGILWSQLPWTLFAYHGVTQCGQKWDIRSQWLGVLKVWRCRAESRNTSVGYQDSNFSALCVVEQHRHNRHPGQCNFLACFAVLKKTKWWTNTYTHTIKQFELANMLQHVWGVFWMLILVLTFWKDSELLLLSFLVLNQFYSLCTWKARLVKFPL